MNIKLKTQKNKLILFSSLAYIVLWLLFYSYPWSGSFEIIIPENSNRKIILELERSNGELESYPLNTQKEKKIKFQSLSIKSVKFENPNDYLIIQEKSKKTQLYEGESYFPSSERNNKIVLGSITLVSLLFTIMIALIMDFSYQKDVFIRYKKTIICFFTHLGLNLYLLSCFLPGLYNYDSFDNYHNASNYYLSAFIGVLYSSWMVVLGQVFASEYLVPVFTAVLISLTLSFLYRFSEKYKMLKIYFLICVVYYITPSNWIMSLNVSRDTFSSWFLILTLIKMYEFFLEKKENIRSKIFLTILVICTCLMRQETVMFLPIMLVLLVLIRERRYLKWAIITSFLTFSIYFIIGILPFSSDPMQKNNYEATVLINPLSYIMFTKYPEGIPEDINKRLGGYFKNDYLIKYYSPYDISPYHRGGVNEEKGDADYQQFKREALKIFIENPKEFLTNRFMLFKCMFGIDRDCMTLYDDSYVREEVPAMMKMKQELGFKDMFVRPAWISARLERFFMIPHFYPILFKSYLIPMIFISICLLLSRKKFWYHNILLFILARTVLVILTTPASQYKYNYVLYLFALLSIPLFIQEKIREKDLIKNA